MASFMMSNPWMDMTVMSWPVVRTDVRKSPRSGPRIPGGSKMVKIGDFGKNPQIWPKMAKLAKMAKTGIFGKTPKMTQKTTFFRECENAFTGALTCDESRRIIYCLDTRYGPQNGGFGPPRGVGRFTSKYGFSRIRENTHFGENRVFRVCRMHTPENRVSRPDGPMESTGSRIDQRSE